jgi:Ca2+-transporting ATPase
MAMTRGVRLRASVEALAQLQVPHARVRRAGRVEAIESTQLVPGDVVLLEAGDLVTADGRIVSRQAAKIVLTDDNFATLVRAVDLGRDIYRRITSYVKLQLTILSSVLQLMLLATIFDVNDGVALFPMQLLFCKFFAVMTVVIGFIVDVPDCPI